MLVDIQSFLLDTGIHTQTMDLLNAVKQDESADCSPEVDHEDTKSLCAEKSPTKAVEGTVSGLQQTRHQRTQDTTDTMY